MELASNRGLGLIAVTEVIVELARGRSEEESFLAHESRQVEKLSLKTFPTLVP